MGTKLAVFMNPHWMYSAAPFQGQISRLTYTMGIQVYLPQRSHTLAGAPQYMYKKANLALGGINTG